MVWGALISGGLSLLGSSSQAESTEEAARTAAQAQLEAARIAADESRFRPIGVTTRFGRSQFEFGIPGGTPPSLSDFKTREQQLDEALKDFVYTRGIIPNQPPTIEDFKTPEEQLAQANKEYQERAAREGRLIGATYTASPMIQEYQRRLEALTGRRLTEAEAAEQLYAPLRGAGTSLMNLGQQYLAETPEQVAQKYMAGQIDLLAPTRERQLAGLRTNLFNTGRTGLAVGATSARPGGGAGLGAASPEMEAYYNVLAQQDAELAAQAQRRGQEQLAFGTSLFNTGANLFGGYESGVTGALSPFTTALGGVSTLENLGMQPLDIGAQLGGRSANAGANVGQFLYGGGIGAARTMQPANMLNPTADFMQGISANKDLMSILGQKVQGLFSPSPYSTTDYGRFGAIYEPSGGVSGSWAY